MMHLMPNRFVFQTSLITPCFNDLDTREKNYTPSRLLRPLQRISEMVFLLLLYREPGEKREVCFMLPTSEIGSSEYEK
jgi:hypothetical protein